MSPEKALLKYEAGNEFFFSNFSHIYAYYTYAVVIIFGPTDNTEDMPSALFVARNVVRVW